MKHRVKLLVAAGMLVAVSSAFGASQFLTLKDSKGEVVYEEKLGSQAPLVDTSRIDYPHLHQSNEILDKELSDGEVGILYVLKNNPDNKLHQRFNPEQFVDFASFNARLGDVDLNIPSALDSGYVFEHGSIQFEPVLDVNQLSEEEKLAIVQDLKEQAEQAGEEYAIKPVDVTDEFWKTYSLYKKGDNQISLQVVNLGEHSGAAYWDDTIQMTKTKLEENGQEAILTRFSDSSSLQLVWIQEDKEKGVNYEYIMNTRGGDIDEEELKGIWMELIQ
ncbi:hypothetical protein [Paenibacillus senegalensis]|uniref:hypothetical protein n=1 Tax=Paenibacillus senegalensis TaxID=1465766 RepID=UPI0011DC7BDC|nr:hypothetical protein [Paenibacillus senegalensis]